MSAGNSAAWVGEDTYTAWVKRFGEPAAAAEAVRDNPHARLGALRQWVQVSRVKTKTRRAISSPPPNFEACV